MTPARREQLFAALMEGVPPVEEIGKVAHREMVEITTDDLDRIEPIIDAMLSESFQAGKRFADRKTADEIAKPREMVMIL